MQALARWLVARPLNTVPALALSLLPAGLSFLSAVVLVLLILQRGPVQAFLHAVGAALVLAALSLALHIPLRMMLFSALSVWLPAAAMAMLMLRTRSLTLTLQVTWIATAAGLLLFFAMVADPAAFWREQIELLRSTFAAQGFDEQAAVLSGDLGVISGQITMVAAVVLWTMGAVGLVLGYKLERELPGVTARFGRFRDLNFGRVLAFATAVASVGAWLSGWPTLQNTASVMFVMFWLQGLSIAHWSHGQGFMPTFGLVALYVLMVLLNVVLVIGLALTGYIDAWFGFRRLKTAS